MEVEDVNGDSRIEEETLEGEEENNEIVPDTLPKDKEDDAVVVSEDSSPHRRMSLRSRSTPKKYLDVEESVKEPVDPLAFSPVKSPVQKSAVTVTKSPVKVLKPVKVMRPPPELIKAPKFPVSSSTSVTVVPKMKVGVEVDVVKQKLMTGPSVTVSTVSPPKQVQRVNPEPVHRPSPVPVKKPTANGNVKNDPFDALGLSDDSFIVEAPSFVVPYLIEKAADEELKKLIERLKPPVKKDAKEPNTSDDDESSDADSKEDQKLKTEADNKPEKTDAEKQRTKDEDDYFNGGIGRFFLDIGLSLVQEHVQGDLLRVQKRKASKGTKISDPSLSVNALSKGLEITKAKNEPYRLPIASCDRCNFKSESKLVMANHWSSPLTLGSGPTLRYGCHWCSLESKDFLAAVSHIETDHDLKSIRTPELAPHQCPLCPFEDVAKSKVTRHMMSCQKRFIPERNLEPPLDWEPPAKIPRSRGLRSYQGMANNMSLNTKGIHLPYHPLLPASAHGTLFGNAQVPKPKPPPMPAFPNPAVASSLLPKAFAGMNPALLQKAGYRQNSNSYTPFTVPNNQVYQAIAKSFQFLQGQVPPPAAPPKHLPSNITAEKVKKSSISMLPGVLNTSGLTIQSAPSSASNKQPRSSNQQPSISITPLPRASASPVVPNKVPASPVIASVAKGVTPAAPKPATPAATTPTKGVVCEICDNSIKDLEQLRHHMQWIHKVKIHPKMIHNRPPLNCQKCQCRFFTDQGLERHLLGSHGLVTSSMQEAANRGQDGGRCPICGKIHQWKLLSHVVKDHGLSLKPAHLSYKCTVCTATFTMYKLFENHVYTAHSVVARKVLDKSENKKSSSSGGGGSGTTSSGVLRINDEITIIPQTQSKCDKRNRVDIIELSDEEDQLSQMPKSQVTITKVPAPSVKKRPKQDNPLE